MTSIGRNGSESYAFGDFVLDCADERLWGPAGAVRIGNKAFRVLCALINNVGRLVTKDELFSTVWDGTVVSESVLTTVIKELRRALGDDMHQPRFISTVYGRGYRFIAAIEAVESGHRPAARSPHPAAEPPLRPTATKAEAQPPLVLVSAFDGEAIRDRQPHLAAALREEVLSGLARFRDIRLIADPRPEQEAIRELGRASPLDYQLTATLLPDDGEIKIIARAKHLADGRVVWADSIALAGTGAAGSVEAIVRRIIGSALPAVDGDIFQGLSRESDDFYEKYLLAKHLSFTARSFAEGKRAADSLESLIAERPHFALAYPPLVRLYNTDFGYTGLGSTGPTERARALDLARAGLAADRGNGHAYTVLGFCDLWNKERDVARRRFEQALALTPYNSARIQEVATGMMFIGDFAAADELMDRARQLNPLLEDDFYEDRGRLDLIRGDYEGARQMLSSIVIGSVWANFYLALAEIELGLEGGRPRLERWRERVEANWHISPAPDARELSRWFMRHHPLPEENNQLFEAAERALCSGHAPAPQ